MEANARRNRAWGAIFGALTLVGSGAPGLHASDELPPIVEVEDPVAKRLSFSTALSRVRYRQETRTKEFLRPAGRKKGKVDEHTLRHDFQVSVWEVPTGSGVLRVETLPVMMGARAGGETIGGKVKDLPVRVRYMLKNGTPCNYYGEPWPQERPTALVFPDRAIAPGDTWRRLVPPSDSFEIPTEVRFRYTKEGRIAGRLCAVIDMSATAKGELPEGRGYANMQLKARFVFEERLGRVIHTKTRLFQSTIGRASNGIPPRKRKVEQLVEMWADF